MLRAGSKPTQRGPRYHRLHLLRSRDLTRRSGRISVAPHFRFVRFSFGRNFRRKENPRRLRRVTQCRPNVIPALRFCLVGGSVVLVSKRFLPYRKKKESCMHRLCVC